MHQLAQSSCKAVSEGGVKLDRCVEAGWMVRGNPKKKMDEGEGKKVQFPKAVSFRENPKFVSSSV